MQKIDFDSFPPNIPSTKLQFVLATDLDGTFLGGNENEREELYHLIRSNRNKVILMFLTGRSVDATLPVISDQLIPTPDILVSDVGATVVDGRTLEPIPAIQTELSQNWPGESAIVEKLKSFSGLKRQKVPQENRVSYYVEDDAPLVAIKETITNELRCNAIYSDGRYLDVLPYNISKGTTLKKIIDKLSIPDEKVLVAGDTLNDLSLFETTCPGVAVSNSEEQLQEKIETLENVHLASKPGAAGILEGLNHHRLISSDLSTDTSGEYDIGDHDLIVACHRLPFVEQKSSDGKSYRAIKNPNGMIATLLRFFDNKESGLWVGSSRESSRTPKNFERLVDVDPLAYPNLKASRIPLTEKDINLFHKKFCKEALWPVIFSFPGKAKFNYEQWNHYVEINKVFAKRIARESAQNALIWLHDYPLWMTPYFLRELRPDLKLTFFHHTTFPPADIFNMLPWSREIISSLLQCDYIAFHIPRYAENFVDVVKSHIPAQVVDYRPCAPRFLSFGCSLGIEEVPTELKINKRRIGLGVHPVGVDPKQISNELKKESVQNKIAEIQSELKQARCILSLERLDYVKGPIEKLLAFEKLLIEHPDLHGKVTLVNVCTPPPDGQTVFFTNTKTGRRSSR